jgi:hypothetical protein
MLLLLALAAATLLPLAGSRSDAATPKLGQDVPAGAEQGLIDTAMGPARWVHLIGDMSTLPAGYAVTSENGVFAGQETQWDESGEETTNLRWTSSDGMHWTAETIDDPDVASPTIDEEGNGASWRMAWQPSRVLRSTDGETWEAIDLTSAIPPGPAALIWDVEPNHLASTDRATLVHVILRAIEPFETLGWREGAVTEVEPGLIGIRGRGEEASPGRLLRLTPTDTGLRVTEEDGGAFVADLPGVSLDDVSGWIEHGQPVEDLLTVVDGDHLVTVKELRYLGDPVVSSLGTVVGRPDGFVALILDETQGPAHLWRSEDGRRWDDLGAWDLPTGEAGGAFYMGQVDGRFHVEYHPPGAGNLDRAWRSDDGLEWDEVWTDIPPDSNLIELTSGTIAQQWIEGGEAWWATANGTDWEPLDLSELGIVIGQQQSSFGEAGDTAFIVVDQEDGRRDMWVLSFDTVPEDVR